MPAYAAATIPVQWDSGREHFAEQLSITEGVTVETAKQVIDTSPSISALAVQLDSLDGFAGVWLNWQPLGLVIAVQGPATAAAVATADKASLPDELPLTVISVEHSYKELVAEQERLLSSLVTASLPRAVSVDVDVKMNRLVVEVAQDDTRGLAAAKALIPQSHLPIMLRPVAQQPVTLAATLSGGGHLAGGSTCTSGFAVRNTSTAVKALLTAGHCSTTASQAGVVLGNNIHDTCPSPYLANQTADRQMHTIPSGHTATNQIFTGGPPNQARTILSAVADNSFYIGQPVEKYGRASGYRTGTVQNVAHSNTTCGGLTQLVKASVLMMIGDSGGPVFQQNLALGIAQAVSTGDTTAFSRIQRSTAGTNYVVCIKTNCAP